MTLSLMPRPPRAITELEAEPVSAISEADLVSGYAGADVVRPCQCGGWIRTRELEKAIAYAVSVHNDTLLHEAWAIAMGYRDA